MMSDRGMQSLNAGAQSRYRSFKTDVEIAKLTSQVKSVLLPACDLGLGLVHVAATG